MTEHPQIDLPTFTPQRFPVTKHRIIVDITSGKITPLSTETFEVEPGRLYFRSPLDQSLCPVDAARALVTPDFIGTTWHGNLVDAYAEAGQEIGRRLQSLATIRAALRAGEEVASV